MKEIKTNIQYKLRYALYLFGIYVLFLTFYGLVKQNYTKLVEHAIFWGVLYTLVYYTYIHRIKIRITNDNKLICKPTNSLSSITIDIQDIHKIAYRRKRIAEITLYYNKEKIKLYPKDATEFIKTLQPICKNAKTFQS